MEGDGKRYLTEEGQGNGPVEAYTDGYKDAEKDVKNELGSEKAAREALYGVLLTERRNNKAERDQLQQKVAELRRVLATPSVHGSHMQTAHEVEIDQIKDAALGVIRVIDAAGLQHLVSGVQLGATSWLMKATAATDLLRSLVDPEDQFGPDALCHVGGEPAACVGRYERQDGPDLPACDVCCGHGNEDGYCSPIGIKALQPTGREP